MTIITHTTWGREFTPEEIEKMETRRAKLIADGVVFYPVIHNNDTTSRQWDTEELANDWVKFANSLTPPPIEIEVVVTE
jgi:hypothetical protein